MSARTFTSIVVQCPDRRTISRLALILLCLGLLVVPTVGAASRGMPSAGVTSPSSQSAQPALQARNTSQTENRTTPTPSPDPIARVENIEVPYTDDTGSRIRPTMTVDAVKINQSTVAIVYQHNQTTKRWYTSEKDVVTAAVWSAPHAPVIRDQFALKIRRAPVFDKQIKPFVTSPASYPRTGVGAYAQEGNETRHASTDYLPEIHIPGPVEAVKSIYQAGVNAVRTGVEGVVDAFNWVVVTLPAPGTPTASATWFPGYASPLNQSQPTAGTPMTTAGTPMTTAGNATTAAGGPPAPPSNVGGRGWWNVAWTIYGGLTALVVLPVFVAWIYAWSRATTSPRERDAQVRQIGQTVGMIVGGVVVMPLALHLTNGLATAIVPDAGMLFATPGNATQFGLGLLVWGLLILVESGLIFTALLILFVEWVVVFFVVAAWPVFAVCLGSGNRYLKPYGESALVAFTSILVLKLVQVIWLRFLLQLPLDFGDPGMSLMTLGATIVGIVLGFIYLPYYVIRNIAPRFVTSLGSGMASGNGTYPPQSSGSVAADGGRMRDRRSSVTWSDGAQGSSSQRSHSVRFTPDAIGAPTATDDSSQPQPSSTRTDKRTRRIEAIRQREYRQDDTFEHFPDQGDWWDDGPARTRTAAETGHSGRTPDGVPGSAISTTSTAVDTAESAAGTVGTVMATAADARRTAKAHWAGIKRYWLAALPGRSRRSTTSVEPLRAKVRRHAQHGWEGAKQRGRTVNDRFVNRDRRRRREQRREHVREQQDAAETAETDDEDEDSETTDEPVEGSPHDD